MGTLALAACVGVQQPGAESPRPCVNLVDPAGRNLGLVIKVGEGTLPSVVAAVTQDGTDRESVAVRRISGTVWEVVVHKDGDVLFDESFVLDADTISLPLDVTVEQLRGGNVGENPGLQSLAEVVREMPRLDLMGNFSHLFPSRIQLSEDGSAFTFGYQDGNTLDGDVLTSANICDQVEAARQADLRFQHCDMSWSEYRQSRQVHDYDCLRCALLAIDPCTGIPFDSQAFVSCALLLIAPNPVLAAICAFVVIMAWSSSAG